MKQHQLPLSPAEIQQRYKRQQLLATGKSITCDYVASKK